MRIVEGEDGKFHITFTGHRAISRNYPRDYTSLGADRSWGPVCMASLRWYEWLKNKRSILNADIHFHNGGAMGFDLAMYYTIIRPAMEEGATWTLHLPWPGYWNPKWNRLPQHIQAQVRACYSSASCEEFGQMEDDGQWQVALLERNKCMVGYADVMCCLWDGKMKGGTWYTVKRSMEWRSTFFSNNKPDIYVIDPFMAKVGVITHDQFPEYRKPFCTTFLHKLRISCPCGASYLIDRGAESGNHGDCHVTWRK